MARKHFSSSPLSPLSPLGDVEKLIAKVGHLNFSLSDFGTCETAADLDSEYDYGGAK